MTARVAVISQRRETASALGDLLKSAGCTVFDDYRGTTDANRDVAIWDCDGEFAASQSSFERLVERWPETAKIVLIGFPRVADQAAALASGAAAVVSKPFIIEDLLWQMRQCLSRV
jgi:DNA-binding response OmpR family regulator